MKNPSNRDLALLGIALVLGALVGWCVKGLVDSIKEPITIENPVNTRLQSRYDSLGGVVALKDSLWKASEKQNQVTDSILINNNKVIKKDYGKLKEMDDSTFYNYLKSRFGAR